MVAAIEPLLREQLLERRHKLRDANNAFHRPPDLTRLLAEVDAALRRMDQGVYGLCEIFHEPVETERLLADPLMSFCLDHLTSTQQRALEEDLQLASQIQTALLPPTKRITDGWEVGYYYRPAGVVSGDYCDLIDGEDQSLHFVLGDVSGKGVAASMLMAHLHAMFRTLVSVNLPLERMVERASRVFCESTLPTQYATLIYGRAGTNGQVELCNAGHLPALVAHNGTVSSLGATGLPVGVFCSETFTVDRVLLEKGDTLFLYTDGLSESVDNNGNEYGVERLANLLRENKKLSPETLIKRCVDELSAFSSHRSPIDDLTLMAIQRTR